MKSYNSSAPRIACAIGAMVMTAITIGLLVVLPSTMEADSQTFLALANSQGITYGQNDACRSLCSQAVGTHDGGKSL